MKCYLDEKKKDILFIWGLAVLAVLACSLRIPYLGIIPLCDCGLLGQPE